MLVEPPRPSFAPLLVASKVPPFTRMVVAPATKVFAVLLMETVPAPPNLKVLAAPPSL